MKKILFVLVILSCALQLKAADEYAIWWKKGNDYYGQKQYDSALFYYEKITALNPADEVVYYNLGNAYYRLNRIGSAVLNYQKALKLNPHYQEAKDNLAIAQSRIANKVPEVPDIFFVSWWNSISNPAKTTTWAVTCLVVFIVILVLLWMRRIRKQNIPVQLIGFLWLFWAIFLIFAFSSAIRTVDSGGAVVMQNDTPFLNSIQGKTQSLVPEGTTVQLKETNGNWAEVRLPDGRTGWMQLSLLAKI